MGNVSRTISCTLSTLKTAYQVISEVGCVLVLTLRVPSMKLFGSLEDQTHIPPINSLTSEVGYKLICLA